MQRNPSTDVRSFARLLQSSSAKQGRTRTPLRAKRKSMCKYLCRQRQPFRRETTRARGRTTTNESVGRWSWEENDIGNLIKKVILSRWTHLSLSFLRCVLEMPFSTSYSQLTKLQSVVSSPQSLLSVHPSFLPRRHKGRTPLTITICSKKTISLLQISALPLGPLARVSGWTFAQLKFAASCHRHNCKQSHVRISHQMDKHGPFNRNHLET